MSERPTSVLEALSEKPTTTRDLAIKLDWYVDGKPDERHVQREVQAARLRGMPICSGSEGLFYAQTSADVLACYRWLRSKYLSQARTAWAMKRAAARLAAKENAPLAFFQDVA